jgi:hypothetical protein
MRRRAGLAVVLAVLFVGPFTVTEAQTCSPSYPDFCIPPPPPNLNCDSPAIANRKNFTALPPDPHGLDGNDNDQLACEDPNQPRFPTTTTTVVVTTTTPQATTTSIAITTTTIVTVATQQSTPLATPTGRLALTG